MKSSVEEKILKKGGVLVEVPGRRKAYQIGQKLIRIIPGQTQVLVGYASDPDSQGVPMPLTKALAIDRVGGQVAEFDPNLCYSSPDGL